MALTIYNNVTALNSQRSLSIANNAQSKSIERLSTGLRINNAADDASGLAISERLRGQISGMQKASTNAQDGISYLQTAEGSIETITNLLQRMRELSVQAGNGIYTTNDRAMLQLEVDQLKEEVDRIAQTSEFNTKKLLDGSATALWSSDSEFIGAIVEGPEVPGGDYFIETDITPGTNSQYKTNIMSVNPGTLVGDVKSAGTTNVGFITNIENMPTTGSQDLEITISSGNSVRDAAAIEDRVLSSAQSLDNIYKADDSNWFVQSATVTDSADLASSGYYELEFTETGSMTSALTYRYRTIDTDVIPPVPGEWTTGTITPAPTTADDATLEIAVGSGNTTIELSFPGIGQVNDNDRMIGIYEPERAAVDYAASGGGTVQIGDGPAIDFTEIGSLTKADDGDAYKERNEVEIVSVSIDTDTGVVSYGQLSLEFEEQTPAAGNTPSIAPTATGTVQAVIRDTGAAGLDTRLSDIESFTNADGVNVLANTQEITIYGNNTSTTVYLESDDTIQDFMDKMTIAIVDGLDMGATTPVSAVDTINDNLVNYVPNLHQVEGTAEAIPGTFSIQTALLGTNSELVFVANQGVMDAIGIEVSQAGQNSSIDVKVTDAATGVSVGTDNINDGKLRSVIGGVSVTIDQNAGVNSSWNTATKTLEFTQNDETSSGYLHLVDNRTELQIGANEGQTLNISIGRLDTIGLDITDVYVTDLELAQRSITKIDDAIQTLNAARATIGAQVNRLEYTINNLSIAEENLAASESRIRDLDIASETTEYTKNQILTQSASSMLAQANQIPQQALQLLQFG